MAARTPIVSVNGLPQPLANGDTLQDAGGNAIGGSGTVDTSGTPVANDIARFTDANTIEGLSYAELKSALGYYQSNDVIVANIGSVSLPGFAFSGDTNTGIFRSSPDILNFATGGVERLEIDSAGADFTVPVIVPDHGTASTDQVVNVCYGTSATPPTASTTTEGALYIQYTA